MRILVVDDSCLDRSLVKRLLAKAELRATVAEADSVDSALEMIEANTFDCALIDYQMPAADGVQFMEKIDGWIMPTIMITASPREEVAEQAFSAGISDFISKMGLSASHLRQSLLNAVIKQRVLQQRIAEGLMTPGEGVVASGAMA